MIIHACDVCNTARVPLDRPWLTLQLDALAPEDAQAIDLCSVKCGYMFFADEMGGELDEQEASMEETAEEFDAAYEAGEEVEIVGPQMVKLRPAMSLADFAAEAQMGGRDESEAAAQGSDTFRRQV